MEELIRLLHIVAKEEALSNSDVFYQDNSEGATILTGTGNGFVYRKWIYGVGYVAIHRRREIILAMRENCKYMLSAITLTDRNTIIISKMMYSENSKYWIRHD